MQGYILMNANRNWMTTAGAFVLVLCLASVSSAGDTDRMSELEDQNQRLADMNMALMDRLDAQDQRLGQLEINEPGVETIDVAATAPSVPGKHSIYGAFAISMNKTDIDDPDYSTTSTDTWSQNSNTSLIGLKGYWGDDLQAFYSLQFGVDFDGTSVSGDVLTRRSASWGVVQHQTKRHQFSGSYHQGLGKGRETEGRAVRADNRPFVRAISN